MPVKVSIILPIYNIEKYLRQCLNSCINQTLKDIEIICVNDGSSDNCLNILEEYAQKDSRIKIINQENQGVSIARNNGINCAVGEYILFLDPDDWISLDCCELTYNQAKENDNNFVYFAHNIYNEESGKIQKCKDLIPCEKIINQKHVDLKKTKNIQYYNNSYIWNKLYNRKWLIDNDMKFIRIKWEDTPFNVTSFLKSSNISFLDKPVYYYRKRNNSLSWTADVEDIIYSRTMPIKFILDREYSGNLLKVYLKYMYRSLLVWYYSIPYSKEQKKKFKNSMIEKFSKLKKYDYRAWIYVFLLKTGLCGIFFNYIRKIFVFLSRIQYYIKHWKETDNEQ